MDGLPEIALSVLARSVQAGSAIRGGTLYYTVQRRAETL